MTASDELRRDALAYLRAHNTVSLATNGTDGPWASSVFYVNLGVNLYFLSEPTTRHSRNVESNPLIAATINEDYKDWREIKGIQMTATCAEVWAKVETARALAAYVRKYPFVASFLRPGQLLQGMQIAGRPFNVRLYKVRPTQMLFLNNARGFSNRGEIPVQ